MLQHASQLSGKLVQTLNAGPHSQNLKFHRSRVDLRICMSKWFPADSDAADPGPDLENHCCVAFCLWVDLEGYLQPDILHNHDLKECSKIPWRITAKRAGRKLKECFKTQFNSLLIIFCPGLVLVEGISKDIFPLLGILKVMESRTEYRK